MSSPSGQAADSLAQLDVAPAVSSATQEKQLTIFREPACTSDLVPIHLKRATTDAHPIIEIAHRFLVRLKPGSGAIVEKVIALIALYRAVSPAWRYMKEALLRLFTSRIAVSEYDPVAQEILLWMSAEVIAKGTTTRASIMTGELGGNPAEIATLYQLRQSGSGQWSKAQGNEISFLPPVGRRIFWVGFRPFLFSRTVQGHSATNSVRRYSNGPTPGVFMLYTPGWSLQPLKDFINKCHDYKIANKAGTTTIYFSSGKMEIYTSQMWSVVVKATRKLDTIDMDEKLKTDLVNDAEYYYSEESRKFFADCGIPYRRGYLFYGPPGTGKTSFSAALAGHLGCDLYIINLATGDISDGRLHSLFLSLPRKCVVVIEDIDSCGIGREQGPASAIPAVPTVPGMPPAPPGMPPQATTMQDSMHPRMGVHSYKRSMVTLSGLLNAIDGNASGEGRLLIMTSNNPDVLDEALTRPGRVDMKVNFGKMVPSAIEMSFKRLIGRAAVGKLGYTAEQIQEYATDFAKKVPADTFTPAQLQNFLQNCRGDPIKALDEIDAWVNNTRDQVPKNDEHLSSSLSSLTVHPGSPENTDTLVDDIAIGPLLSCLVARG